MKKIIKKPITIMKKDYSPMVSNCLYAKEEIRDRGIISRKQCISFNHLSRNVNTEYFNKVLHKSIVYFLNKNNINRRDLKIILGLNCGKVDLIYNENKFNRDLNFKLIYDICDVMDVDMKEMVERMEYIFTMDE